MIKQINKNWGRNWVGNLMEIEQKIRVGKQEISLIHEMCAICSLEVSHKFGSEFPSKQAKKWNGINHMRGSMLKKKNQLLRRNYLFFWYRELWEFLSLCLHKENMLMVRKCLQYHSCYECSNGLHKAFAITFPKVDLKFLQSKSPWMES